MKAKLIKNFSEFIKIVLNEKMTENKLNGRYIWRDKEDLNVASYYMYLNDDYNEKKSFFRAWQYFDLKNNVHVIAEENENGIFEIAKIEKIK